MRYSSLKEKKNEKKFLTLKLSQTCMNLFILLNTKEHILKNIGNLL